jgi:uncharacterized protein DUF2474
MTGVRDEASPAPSRLVRLGWLIAIWAASVLALGVVAWVIRQLMGFAGLTVR